MTPNHTSSTVYSRSTSTDDPQALLVDARSASAMLGVSERTLSTLTRDNAVPSLTVGRRRLYPVSGLHAWIYAGCPIMPGSAASLRWKEGGK